VERNNNKGDNMKFKYYYAKCVGDNDCYSIRTALKREAVEIIGEDTSSFGPIVKVEFTTSPLKALFRALEENGIYEEAAAVEDHWRAHGCKCRGLARRHEKGEPFVGPDDKWSKCKHSWQ
jgi:hypothetical protein